MILQLSTINFYNSSVDDTFLVMTKQSKTIKFVYLDNIDLLRMFQTHSFFFNSTGHDTLNAKSSQSIRNNNKANFFPNLILLLWVW